MFGDNVKYVREFRCVDVKTGREFVRKTDRACTMLELLSAINQWNRGQTKLRFVYYVDEHTSPELPLGGKDAIEIFKGN